MRQSRPSTTRRSQVRRTGSRRTTAYTYDAKGNVLGYVDYTTNDATGSLALAAPITNSQTTGWVFNAQQLPVLALYREQKAGVSSAPSLFLFTYDTQGNLSQFTQLVNNKLETGKLTAYNANGAFLAGTSTSNQAVKHTYTPRGQLATTNVAGQITTYTYDAIGQSKQVTYPNGDKLNYSYSPAHKLQSIKWNGTEQYTPTAGISSNLASLATLGGYNGISNPELAYKLGVNATTLDALDAAPKVLTQTSNAAVRLAVDTAVELAKGATIGKEARAAGPLALGYAVVELGGASAGWGSLAALGASLGVGAWVEDKNGVVRNASGSKICEKGQDPDDCNKIYAQVQNAKQITNSLPVYDPSNFKLNCTGVTNTTERAARRLAYENERRIRTIQIAKCFPSNQNPDEGHWKRIYHLGVGIRSCI